MVIYTEKELVDRLAHERERVGSTKFVVTAFDDLPHYRRICACNPAMVRNHNPGIDRLDNLAINWAKYALLAQNARENPFGTTHIAWCNLGLNNVEPFVEGWQDAFDPPDKVRLHQQRYLNPAVIGAPEWYAYGHCPIAGGFLSGDIPHLLQLEADFYPELYRAIGLGFGAVDEEVLATLLVREPEKYAISYGDYGQMLCNARRPRWGGGTLDWAYNHTLYWMIREALEAADIPWARRLWRLIMDAAAEGVFKDDTAPLEQFRGLLGEG
jgi:hypothetical protein